MRALLIGVAVTLPVIFGIALDHLEIGLAVCFGAFWSSPSNTPGSFRHKKMGILFSSALVTLISFIGGYLSLLSWGIIPAIGVLTFAIAFISIYGFRASLISFSGLLALVLSFAHTPTELEIFQYSLLIGVGGLWYLLLVIVAYKINPKAQADESLSETFLLTARFIKTRGKLMGDQPDRVVLQKKLQDLQTELIDHHETLRDILISTRKTSGFSAYQDRQLLIFVKLVEILETAIANPIEYEKMDAVFIKHPELQKKYQDVVFEVSNMLYKFAKQKHTKLDRNSNTKLTQLLNEVRTSLNALKPTDITLYNQQYLPLENLMQYQEKQIERISQIIWLLNRPKLQSADLLSRKNLDKFLVPQDYDPKLWLRNLSFKSTIFKHSLRLAVTVMVGYAIGMYFKFQNPYWILLTIIVIMRPSYGLTKSRTKDRLIGTLVGGILAALLLLLIHNTYAQGAIGIVAIIIAFSIVQKNYKVSATFITISIIFIYAILRPDILVVIQYRILDTVIGAALSFMAVLWLWPAWGFLEIKKQIINAVTANKTFFTQITTYYIEKGTLLTSLKVARKQAFLETSNLNAAFQKIVQEPKSKQKNKDIIYEFVALNHTALSSLASLSTFLQHNKTTPASAQFIEATKLIDDKISNLISCLNEDSSEISKVKNINRDTEITEVELAQRTSFEEIVKSLPVEKLTDKEANLIWEQLQWLNRISEQMLKLGVGLQF